MPAATNAANVTDAGRKLPPSRATTVAFTVLSLLFATVASNTEVSASHNDTPDKSPVSEY